MSSKNEKQENMSYDVEDISRTVRTERPGNYLFKIESFSLLEEALQKSKRDKYDSCHFEAEGYKWKVSVYPNGDKKRGGDGYISLYLALADPKSLAQGEEVRAIFKFYVFDYLRDNYLVLQDGRDRRFHELNTKWGFAKSLSLEIFKDPTQGYLFNDCCAFGVEMFFHKNASKERSSLSLKNNLDTYESIFTWKIDKFSTLQETQLSDEFSVGGVKWKLKLYPNGDYREKGKSMSLFLCIQDHSSFPRGWNIYADYTFSILNQLNKENIEIKSDVNSWFSGTCTSWGYSDFMQLSDLKDASKGFIVNDTVVIEVKLITISVVNNFL